MRYQANPVIVDAFRIVGVFNNSERVPLQPKTTGIYLLLEDGKEYQPEPEMMSRMSPQVGDYIVIQPDRYTYLNPKDVFERKYSQVKGAAWLTNQ